MDGRDYLDFHQRQFAEDCGRSGRRRRPKKVVSISISLRVVARTFLRRHSRQMRSHILMSGNVREAGSKASRHFQRIFLRFDNYT